MIGTRILAKLRATQGWGRRSPAWRLRRNFTIALGLIACLAIVGQFLLHEHLRLQRQHMALLDVVAKQRSACQQAVRGARSVSLAANEGDFLAAITRVRQALDQWNESRQQLASQLAPFDIDFDVTDSLVHEEKYFRNAQRLLSTAQRPPSPERQLTAQRYASSFIDEAPTYLEQLDALTGLAQGEFERRQWWLSRMAIALLTVLLLALLLNASVVFRRGLEVIRGLTVRAQHADARAVDMAAMLQATEAELKKLAMVAGATESVVFITDIAGNIEWINASFTNVTGTTADQAIGRRVEDVLCDPTGKSITIDRLHRTAMLADEGKNEVAVQGVSGKTRWLGIDAKPITDEFSQRKNYIVVATDLTEHKQIAQRGGRYEQILRSLPEALAVVDLKGNVAFANTALGEMTGFEPREMVGRGHHDLLRHSRPDGMPFPSAGCPVCRAIVAGKPQPGRQEMVAHSVDGPHRVGYAVTPLLEQGKRVGSIVTLHPQADNGEMPLAQLQARRCEALQQLVCGLASEMDSPLGHMGDNVRFLQDAIGGVEALLGLTQRLVEAARRGSLSPELLAAANTVASEVDFKRLTNRIPAAVEESLQATQRMTTVVGAMKSFTDSLGDRHEPTDLNRAISSVITIARSQWRPVAEVVTDFDFELPMVTCLPGEFNQAMLNLLANAADAIGEAVPAGGKGAITVSTRREDDCVEIRVADTGNGIPQELQGRIFDAGFAAESNGRAGRGLAIAYSAIVEHHGGAIGFETEPGRGTTFIIRLPIESQVVASQPLDTLRNEA